MGAGLDIQVLGLAKCVIMSLTGGFPNEYVIRPLDPESASVAIAVKMSVPMGCDWKKNTKQNESKNGVVFWLEVLTSTVRSGWLGM